MSITIEAINERNKCFWQETNEYVEDTIVNRISVVEEALGEIRIESTSRPLYSRRPLEKVLKDVDAKRKLHQSEFSKLGGKAGKPDKLNVLISQIVERNLAISCLELLDALRLRQHTSSIQSIENDEILLSDRKVVPVSGLKDRLSRAKKKIRDTKNRATG